MFCTKCGAELSEESKFCCRCGAPVPAEQKDTIFDNTPKPTEQAEPKIDDAPATPRVSYDGEGILGILGFVLSFVAPFAALIVSLIGWRNAKNRNFALAGIIISTIVMVSVILIFAFALSNLEDPSIPLYVLITAIF